MTDTVRVQVRWPRPLIDQLHRIAGQRHTTFSELIRQAAIAQYSLGAHDVIPVKNGADVARAGSL